MSLSFFSSWAIGALNGYTQKEGGLPAGIKYNIMGLTTIVGAIRVLGLQPQPIRDPRALLGNMLVAVPLLVGTSFCLGNSVGKGVRLVEDRHFGLPLKKSEPL
jgi:hypothetical protein